MGRPPDYEVYRVTGRFNWDGWEYAPDYCTCAESCSESCTNRAGSGCTCQGNSCRCACGIKPERWAGDIWFVRPRHPRKEAILEGLGKKASGDATLPPVSELLKQGSRYRALLIQPGAEAATPEKQRIPA